jgi:hypothetical protein
MRRQPTGREAAGVLISRQKIYQQAMIRGKDAEEGRLRSRVYCGWDGEVKAVANLAGRKPLEEE